MDWTLAALQGVKQTQTLENTSPPYGWLRSDTDRAVSAPRWRHSDSDEDCRFAQPELLLAERR